MAVHAHGPIAVTAPNLVVPVEDHVAVPTPAACELILGPGAHKVVSSRISFQPILGAEFPEAVVTASTKQMVVGAKVEHHVVALAAVQPHVGSKVEDLVLAVLCLDGHVRHPWPDGNGVVAAACMNHHILGFLTSEDPLFTIDLNIDTAVPHGRDDDLVRRRRRIQVHSALLVFLHVHLRLRLIRRLPPSGPHSIGSHDGLLSWILDPYGFDSFFAL